MIASPISDVDTSFAPFDKISFVLKPSFSTIWTAFSNVSASLSSSREYLSAIAKLNIEAIGFAIPLPAISGADPCIGSYIALISQSLFLAPSEAEGKSPNEPVNIDA